MSNLTKLAENIVAVCSQLNQGVSNRQVAPLSDRLKISAFPSMMSLSCLKKKEPGNSLLILARLSIPISLNPIC